LDSLPGVAAPNDGLPPSEPTWVQGSAPPQGEGKRPRHGTPLARAILPRHASVGKKGSFAGLDVSPIPTLRPIRRAPTDGADPDLFALTEPTTRPNRAVHYS
jgi:hypothetical protein